MASFLSVTMPPPSSSSSSSSLRKSVSVTMASLSSSCPSLRKSQFVNLRLRNPSQTLTLTFPPLATSNGVAVATDSLKTRLRNGETLYGIFLLSSCPTIAEIAGLSGFDFAVVDMEHGPGGISDALSCIRALDATNTAAIVRLPESSAAWAKKALDLGPQGLMFPMIEGPESAEKAVSYCRFAPNGVRSANPAVRASGYGTNGGYSNLIGYEENLLIMCQVESEEGVKKIDEILDVDGVDCIQMGPNDLSATLGCLWDPSNKKVREVLRGVEKAVLRGGGERRKYLSGFAMPHDPAEELRRRGYHMVLGATDVGMFRTAAVEGVKKFKMSLEYDGVKKFEMSSEVTCSSEYDSRLVSNASSV